MIIKLTLCTYGLGLRRNTDNDKEVPRFVAKGKLEDFVYKKFGIRKEVKAMNEDVKKIGRWLESTITEEPPERLDEPFPVRVTGLDILRMKAGLLPKGAEKVD